MAEAVPDVDPTKGQPQPAGSPPRSAAVENPDVAKRISSTGRFEVADIDLLRATFERYDFTPGTPWDDFAHAVLAMPDWFRFDLDPMSRDYENQQRQLWRLIAGVDHDYDPEVDEREISLPPLDAVRFPGYYIRRDPLAVNVVANHVLATGMIMMHSGLKPGQWALEYGAGFAHTALQLARLGVNVDTVDISEVLCRHVQTQASFFGVPLTPFRGTFGRNPRDSKKYDFIWFYESFHHCADFKSVVHQLKQHLAAGGRVLLAGEPIPRRENRTLPYPWGLRIEAEVVAVMRSRHWLELGFREDFIVGLFVAAGFSPQRMECPMSIFGAGYLFTHRTNTVQMATQWLPLVEGESWHEAQSDGRWTKDHSYLSLDATETFRDLELDLVNHHPFQQPLDLQYGLATIRLTLHPGERRTVLIPAATKATQLHIRSATHVPASNEASVSPDNRRLGVYVTELRYR